MTPIFVLIWGFMLTAGVCTMGALAWYLSSGQAADMEAAAASIFDDDERAHAGDLAAASVKKGRINS